MQQRAALLLVVVLTGCRFDGVPLPPAWTATAPAPGALPYRLAIAPVDIDRAIASRRSDLAGSNGSAPDPESVRRGLVEALRAGGAFDRVEARGARRSDVEEAAWSEADDLVLEVEVRDHWQEYRGHSNYVGWFVIYAAALWPAWFVPVDYYGAGLEARVRLRGVQGGAPVLERVYEVRPDETEQELTPSDRELAGFLDWGALWNIEASLEASNWRAIERSVAPHAWRRFQEELLRDIDQEVVRPLRDGTPDERERILRRVRKRFAVAVGVSRYADEAVSASAYAADDARALAGLFARPEGGGLVPGRDLTLLVDEQATRAALLSAIAAVASRASPCDEVVLYVAATGAALPRAVDPRGDPSAGASLGGVAGAWRAPACVPALLLRDASAADVAGSALRLVELGRALDALRAERIVIIFDGSFGPEPCAGRDVVDALRLSPGRVALLAARPGQPARGLPGGQTGLFAQVLRAGITGAADADEDGRVTLGEAVEHARAAVARRAALEGFEQEPVALGQDGAASLGWPR